MLTNLYIENIAVIEKTSIDFGSGLNVLTGETGAGKSIIIDSINAVLGNRTSRDLVRNGCDNAFVSAVFSEPSESVEKILKENGFDTEDGELLIQREISLSGKGKCRINGRPATVSVLKAIGTGLINIHGQHESYELMSPELHINYIDKLGELAEDLEEYQTVYSNYKDLQSKLKKSQSDEAERARKIDLLSYQVNEIEEADLYIGELEDLNEQRNIIENREKIASALNEAREYLNGSEEADGAIQLLDAAVGSMSNISTVLADSEAVSQRLQNALYELEDCCDEVVSMWDDADSDIGSLEEIEDRLDLIHTLSRKYGSTIEEILDFLDKAKDELEYLKKYEENRETLMQSCKKANKEAVKLAEALSHPFSVNNGSHLHH